MASLLQRICIATYEIGQNPHYSTKTRVNYSHAALELVRNKLMAEGDHFSHAAIELFLTKWLQSPIELHLQQEKPNTRRKK